MSESQGTKVQGRPWHLWVVGILFLLFGGMGALDYIMTATMNEAYLAKFSQEMLDFYFGFPGWAFVLWAVGSFGSLIGALLLLLRKGISIWFLVASLVAGIIMTVYTYVFKEGVEITGTAGLIASIVFSAIGALLVLYAHRMRAKGVLT